MRRSLMLAVVVLCCGRVSAQTHPDAAWVEVRSAHFVVRCNAGEKRAREIADRFERVRRALQGAFARGEGRPAKDPRLPLIVFAAADEASFLSVLPSEWSGAAARRPPGLFLRTPDRHYVLLRADLASDRAYQPIDHEYFHLLEALNLPELPVWLSEGWADFHAGAVAGSGEVALGRGMLHHKLLLRDAKEMIPLKELLEAQRASNLYRDPQRSKLFYAQSWALVHLLELGDPQHAGKLGELLRRLQAGVPAAQAHAEVLGDPRILQRQLANYVRRNVFPTLILEPVAPPAPNVATARTLTRHEADVALAELYLAENRLADVRRVLEPLMRAAPETPGAHDAFGQLLMRRGDAAGAWAEFSRAIVLGSRDWRTHYSLATVLARSATTAQELQMVEKNLRGAVELNPESPEATSALAGFLLDAGREIEFVLDLARRAVALEPEDEGQHFLLSRALRKHGKREEARRSAERALALAPTQAAKSRVQEYLKGFDAAAPAAAPVYQSTVREVILWVKDEAAEEALRRWKAEREAVAHIQTFTSGRVLKTVCAAKPGLQLELESEQGTLKLRARDANIVAYYVSRGTPPKKFNPCRDLKDKWIDVVYRPTPKASVAGEILAIEMKD